MSTLTTSADDTNTLNNIIGSNDPNDTKLTNLNTLIQKISADNSRIQSDVSLEMQTQTNILTEMELYGGSNADKQLLSDENSLYKSEHTKNIELGFGILLVLVFLFRGVV